MFWGVLVGIIAMIFLDFIPILGPRLGIFIGTFSGGLFGGASC